MKVKDQKKDLFSWRKRIDELFFFCKKKNNEKKYEFKQEKIN